SAPRRRRRSRIGPPGTGRKRSVGPAILAAPVPSQDRLPPGLPGPAGRGGELGSRCLPWLDRQVLPWGPGPGQQPEPDWSRGHPEGEHVVQLLVKVLLIGVTLC